MPYGYIDVERRNRVRNRVGIVTFSRPERLNAPGEPMEKRQPRFPPRLG